MPDQTDNRRFLTGESMMSAKLQDLILNYDPLAPDLRFADTATEFAAALAAPKLPKPVPWPNGFAPFATALDTSITGGPLPKCDVLVVTWTAAEARALATLFTPGVQIESWGRYTHKLADFIPKVTGLHAPFRGGLPMYHHVLGLFHPCQIGKANILCFKSGLHLDYDGPDMPVKDLWEQIIDETGASVVITTGTAGGIGANIMLGDVVIAEQVRFDCTTKFKNEPFNHSSYATGKLPADTFTHVTSALLEPNGDALNPINTKLPRMLYSGSADVAHPVIVSTDFFAYDDSNDTFGLQKLGNACEMGDAVLGLVMKDRGDTPLWVAIRNASDPQIDGSLPKEQRDKVAGDIYKKYGLYTTVGSVIASWAVIRSTVAEAAIGATPPPAMAATIAAAFTPPPAPQPSPEAVLLAAVSADDAMISPGVSPSPADLAAFGNEAQRVGIDVLPAAVSWRGYAFTDEAGSRRELRLANISQETGIGVFRGSYLFEAGRLVARQEFTGRG
ncbi:hypothetical protein EOA30_04940 [Mesorhizobium sp. M8A.F.Ca.ET.059.01.1.1]|nr:hypothetical protein EOA30_04940 [Mesorhizobium sp. M8A.F.Ca.ET.059.01.1.1]